MKNLFLFFNRTKFFMFFILLQLIVFTIISRNSSYQQTSILNSSSSISGWMYQQKKSVSDYFNLRKENEILSEQNALLKQESFNNYSIVSDNEILIKKETYERQYSFQPSVIIQNSVNKRKNILTMNIGRNKEVKQEMGVVNSRGIVGFTLNSSAHYSTIMSLMHEDFRIPVKPLNDSCVGVLTWLKQDKINEISVKGIPSYFNIKKGDTIVSQGGSGIFPKGEFVGVVKTIQQEAGNNNQVLKLITFVDFNALNHVFVVKNIYQEEVDSLQNIEQN